MRLSPTLSLVTLMCISGSARGQALQADNLPAPGLAAPNYSHVVPKPANVDLKLPNGFSVSLYAENLPGVRWMQWAPNGDLFVSQYAFHTVTVLRDTNADGKPDLRMVYAQGTPPTGRDGRPNPAAPTTAGPTAGPNPVRAGDNNRGDRGGDGRRGGPTLGPIRLSPERTAAAAVPCTPPPVTTPATAVVPTVGVRSPMGMAFRDGFFYVANTDSIIRYRYTMGISKLRVTRSI